jgi:integrase
MSENGYWLSKPQQITVYGELLESNFQGQALAPHYIYYKKMIDRVLYKFSTSQTIPALAYKFAPKMLKDKMDEEKKPTLSRNIFRDYFPQFLDFKKKQVADGEIKLATVKVIERTEPKILDFWRNKFLNKLDERYDVKRKNLECWEKQFDEYVKWFRENYPKETMFNALKYLNAYVNWMHRNGLIRRRINFKDPNAKVERKKRKVENTKILSDSEIQSLLEKANQRQQLAILFGYFMAFRISDVTELSWDRINLDPDDPYIEFLGDDKEETFGRAPINGPLFIALVELKKVAKSKWVFPQRRNPEKHFWPQNLYMEVLFEKAGLPDESFHILRHTRLTLDFGNPKIPDSDVMIMRRVSYEVALDHYLHPNKDSRKRMVESESSQLSVGVQKIIDGLNLYLLEE